MSTMNTKKSIKKLLIDYDIICFETAFKSEKEVFYIPEHEEYFWNKKDALKFCKDNKISEDSLESIFKKGSKEEAFKMIDDKINEILLDFEGITDYCGFLTGKNNFRYRIATILPYKGNRVKRRMPEILPDIREYLINKHHAIETNGEEADDALGYNQTETTCICSTDKDMKTIPYWHYCWATSWNKNKSSTFYVDPLDSLRFFYSQIITGDKGDNILGIFGMSDKSKAVQTILTSTTEKEMFELVRDIYHKYFGNYGDQFLLETGRLLYIRKKSGEFWNFPKFE